jgi:hypothetical protein
MATTEPAKPNPKLTDIIYNHLEFLNSKDEADLETDDWDDDDDTGYLMIPVTEEEFFEMELVIKFILIFTLHFNFFFISHYYKFIN